VIVHSLFDVLALLAALAAFRWIPIAAPNSSGQGWLRQPYYLAAASLGVTSGVYLAGSANLWLTGVDGIPRSIEGALAGGILAVEVLKALTGIRGSTGLRFVAPLCTAIAVGRIGCFIAGLEDMTHGVAIALPWASISATACRAIPCSSLSPRPWRSFSSPSCGPRAATAH
jgi:hypothetical protein